MKRKTNRATQNVQFRASVIGFILAAAILSSSPAMAQETKAAKVPKKEKNQVAIKEEDTPPDILPSFPDWQCLYVGDYARGCIYKITSDKKVTVYAQKIGVPGQMFFDEKGVLYAANYKGAITVTPTEDGSPATFDNGHVKQIVDGHDVGGLNRVHGLIRDKEGNLWLGEFLGEDTGKKNRSGQIIYGDGKVCIFSPDGKLRTVAHAQVYSMSTGPAGDVYISQQMGGQLIKITPDGTKTPVAKGFVCRTTTFDKEGNAYAVAVNNIYRLDKAGFADPSKWPWDFSKLTKETSNDIQSIVLSFKDDPYGDMHPFTVVFDAIGNCYQSDPPPDKRVNPKTCKGFIYHFDPKDGKRYVFLRVGTMPAWMAFYPTSKPE